MNPKNYLKEKVGTPNNMINNIQGLIESKKRIEQLEDTNTTKSRLSSQNFKNSSLHTARNSLESESINQTKANRLCNDQKSLILTKNYAGNGYLSSCEKQVLSKEFSLVPNPSSLRKSLEPLHIKDDLSDSETSQENHSVYLTAKATRTGFIPFCTDMGLK